MALVLFHKNPHWDVRLVDYLCFVFLSASPLLAPPLYNVTATHLGDWSHIFHRLLDSSGSALNPDDDPLVSTYSLMSADPALSLMCRLARSLSKILQLLGFALAREWISSCGVLSSAASCIPVSCSHAVIVLVSALAALVRYRWKQKEEQTKQLYALVEQVLGKLLNRSLSLI